MGFEAAEVAKKGLTMLSENIAHVLSQPLLKKMGDLQDLKTELLYHIRSYELWGYALIIGLKNRPYIRIYIYIYVYIYMVGTSNKSVPVACLMSCHLGGYAA